MISNRFNTIIIAIIITIVIRVGFSSVSNFIIKRPSSRRGKKHYLIVIIFKVFKYIINSNILLSK